MVSLGSRKWEQRQEVVMRVLKERAGMEALQSVVEYGGKR